MNDFKYLSDKYDIHKTQNYRLSIQFNPDGFSVLMTDQDGQIMMIHHRNTSSWAGTFHELKENNEFLPLTRMKFNCVKLLLNHHKMTLVPAEFYSDDLKSFFYLLNHSGDYNDDIYTVKLPEFETFMIFGANEAIIKIFRLFHNKPEITHSSVPYLNYLKRKFPDQRGIFLQVTGNLLTISSFNRQNLNFHNIIPVTGENDIIYHTLNTCRQLNENSCEHVYLSGIILEESESMHLMKKYFGKIHMLPNELPFELAWDLNENYFTNLLESLNCA